MSQIEKFLIRLALNGRLPFSRLFLAWSSKRQFANMAPTSAMRYDFEIPDPSRPIPEEERGVCGPSGHLIEFVPHEITAADVVGRQVDEVVPNVGTYGMGGPGFLGFKLGEDWLVFAIWGAGEWIKVDDLLVVDYHFEAHKRPQPWISNADDRLSPKLAGTEISSLDIQPRSLEMSFSNGMLLTINEAPEGREFLDGDDLRKAVFFAPTTEIWV